MESPARLCLENILRVDATSPCCASQHRLLRLVTLCLACHLNGGLEVASLSEKVFGGANRKDPPRTQPTLITVGESCALKW